MESRSSSRSGTTPATGSIPLTEAAVRLRAFPAARSRCWHRTAQGRRSPSFRTGPRSTGSSWANATRACAGSMPRRMRASSPGRGRPKPAAGTPRSASGMPARPMLRPRTKVVRAGARWTPAGRTTRPTEALRPVRMPAWKPVPMPALRPIRTPAPRPLRMPACRRQRKTAALRPLPKAGRHPGAATTRAAVGAASSFRDPQRPGLLSRCSRSWCGRRPDGGAAGPRERLLA